MFVLVPNRNVAVFLLTTLLHMLQTPNVTNVTKINVTCQLGGGGMGAGII